MDLRPRAHTHTLAVGALVRTEGAAPVAEGELVPHELELLRGITGGGLAWLTGAQGKGYSSP